MTKPSDEPVVSSEAPGDAASSKTTKRTQEPFLNDLRKRKLHVELYLMSGVRLTGTIESFDAQMVLLKSHDTLELVNKQLISTIVPARRPVKGGRPRPDRGGMGDRERPPMRSMRKPGPPMPGEAPSQPSTSSSSSSDGPRVSYRARRIVRTPGDGSS